MGPGLRRVIKKSSLPDDVRDDFIPGRKRAIDQQRFSGVDKSDVGVADANVAAAVELVERAETRTRFFPAKMLRLVPPVEAGDVDFWPGVVVSVVFAPRVKSFY